MRPTSRHLLDMASLERCWSSSSRESQHSLVHVTHVTHVLCRPTRSPYWNKMSEYIGAEMAGKKEGDCRKFEKDCQKSLYKLNKYS